MDYWGVGGGGAKGMLPPPLKLFGGQPLPTPMDILLIVCRKMTQIHTERESPDRNNKSVVGLRF